MFHVYLCFLILFFRLQECISYNDTVFSVFLGKHLHPSIDMSHHAVVLVSYMLLFSKTVEEVMLGLQRGMKEFLDERQSKTNEWAQ